MVATELWLGCKIDLEHSMEVLVLQGTTTVFLHFSWLALPEQLDQNVLRMTTNILCAAWSRNISCMHVANDTYHVHTDRRTYTTSTVSQHFSAEIKNSFLLTHNNWSCI